MGSSPLSSREIVERLWDEVRHREALASKSTVPELSPNEELIHGEALRYINIHASGRPPAVETHAAKGLKQRARRRLARFVVGLFGDYLAAEREFNGNVVRVCNSVARGHDRVSSEVREVAQALRTESARLADEFGLLHALLEARVGALEEESRQKRS